MLKSIVWSFRSPFGSFYDQDIKYLAKLFLKVCLQIQSSVYLFISSLLDQIFQQGRQRAGDWELFPECGILRDCKYNREQLN